MRMRRVRHCRTADGKYTGIGTAVAEMFSQIEYQRCTVY